MIVPIGEWVLRQACNQLLKWDHIGMRVSKVSVNLSARQFQDSNLVALVEDVLLQTGVKPYRLELEITESMLMDDVQQVLETLKTLKNWVYGSPSMILVLAIPPELSAAVSAGYTQNRQEFHPELAGEENDEQIVEAIVAIAHGLNLGSSPRVWKPVIKRPLTRLGCQEVQGYLYGKAMPPDLLLRCSTRERFALPGAGLALECDPGSKNVHLFY